jgi:photosystem II stability/assembly factor-like uncharacterized protein
MKMSSGRALALAVLPVLLAGAGAGTASARPASGNPPPPKGFEADSASFVSAQAGFVLGARHCSELPCTARLEKTVNGGQSWTRVPAPPVSLVPPYTGSPRSAVSTVRFENARDGWLFNPGLWVTTDGGRQWHRAAVPGVVTALAASDGIVFAAAKPARAGLDTARLYRSQVGSTSWSLVPGVSPAGALTVSGHSVWAGIAPELWTTTDSGQHWSALPFRCPRAELSASPVAAASASDVALACSDQGFPQPGFSRKVVFTSTDGGRTFQQAGRPAEPGQVRMLAMPPLNPQVITLTADSGASYLYRSVDGGHTWNRRTFFDGGLEVRDLAYASASTGYLIHFSGGPVIAYGLGLMKTVNAGSGWTSVAIP